MTALSARGSAHPPLLSVVTGLVGILALAAGFALVGYALITLTLDSGRLAAFWIGNAVVIGTLAHRPLAWQAPAVLACFIANLSLNLHLLDMPSRALTLSSANLLEISGALWAIRRFLGPSRRFDGLHHFGIIALIAFAGPAITGVLVASVMGQQDVAAMATVYQQWLSSHCLPIAILTPLVLIVRDPAAWLGRVDAVFVTRLVSVVLALAIVIPVIFLQRTFPFLFLAAPVVVFAAFRTGLLGTALAVAVLTGAATLATFEGLGPITLVKGGPREQIIALQAFAASLVALGLPVAGVLVKMGAIKSELRDSRDFLSSIIEGISDTVFRVDGAWAWTFLNRRSQGGAGLALDAELGEVAFAQVITEDQAALLAWRGAVEAGLRPGRIVVRMALAGTVRHIALGLEPQFDAEGRFLGGVGTLSDVTESVQQAHALSESEARFRRLAQASPVGVFQSNARGQVVYVNPEWQRLTGLVDGEWEEGRWARALHPEDKLRLQQGWLDSRVQREGGEQEIRWLHKDGSTAWAHIVFRAVLGAGGAVTGYVGVAIDITARKDAELALARREKQLTVLADNATDAVVRLSLDGVCAYASPSAREVFGVEARLLLGQQLITGFHPDDAAAVTKAFAALAAGTQDRVRTTFRSRSLVAPDTFNWLEANCGLVRDPATGAPDLIIAALRNVNATKRLEAELVAAKEAAESAAAAKTAFLANMSHEIRTPMNGVIGFTELALAGPLPSEQRQNLEMIAESGRAMLRLLNDLLDLAKIDAGQMKIAAEPLDIRHKLRSALRLMEPVASQKGLTMTLAIDDAVPACLVSDPLRLRQMVLNLIGNALKFTEHGGVRVTVSWTPEARLRIAVADTGIGIPPEQLGSIFDKFTQADATIARRFGGTGLGLPISAELAQLMGGSLQVASTPGAGSVFTLELPGIVGAAAETPLAADRDADTAGLARGVRVLVAEDNPINQTLTLAMLAKTGAEAELAADGAAAIAMVEAAAARGRPYQLVLMDLQMPQIDGLEATRRLRAAGFGAEALPIVALTANAYADDVAACHAAGMQDHLAKPMRGRELEAMLRRWARAESVAAGPDIVVDPCLATMFAERKLAALAAITDWLRSSADNPAALAPIAQLLHQIAGVAAFFDEAELGQVAGTIEHQLRDAGSTDVAALLRQMQDRLAA